MLAEDWPRSGTVPAVYVYIYIYKYSRKGLVVTIGLEQADGCDDGLQGRTAYYTDRDDVVGAVRGVEDVWDRSVDPQKGMW